MFRNAKAFEAKRKLFYQIQLKTCFFWRSPDDPCPNSDRGPIWVGLYTKSPVGLSASIPNATIVHLKSHNTIPTNPLQPTKVSRLKV